MPAALALAACGNGSDDPFAATVDDATMAAEATQPTDAGADPDPDDSDDGDDGDVLPSPGSDSTEAEPDPTGDGDDPTGDGDGDGGDPTGDGGDPDWPAVDLRLAPVAHLDAPIDLAPHPASDDLWVAERDGRVRRLARTGGGSGFEVVDEPVVDLADQVTTEGEGGLLGLVFAPDGGALYLHYTNRDGDNTVSELAVTLGSGGPTVTGPERILLTVDQPYSNHNGGDLAFGPDGLLYVSLGDGGRANDPLEAGQDRSLLLGSILRLDPTPGSDRGYTVPPTNPFVDGPSGARPEIWAWGLRNPWRFSFDQATGDLWIADVGQGEVEEIDHLPAGTGPTDGGRGANLGWNRMEGDQPFQDGTPPPDHVGPVFTYGHDEGRCSVTGGYVYRGALVPALDGVYLFADFCSGEVFGLDLDGGQARAAVLHVDPDADDPVGFGQDKQGEIYLIDLAGTVSRIEPA